MRHFGLGKMWLVDFNAGKTQLVLFARSNNTASIDVKMGESVLEEKSSFKMLESMDALLNWIRAFKLSQMLKLPLRKL